jgi:nucleosome binding factor SPN SPT16 subunit
MSGYFVDEMSGIVDAEKKVTHEALSKKLEMKIEDEKFFKNKDLRMPSDFDPIQLDWGVHPVIESGGKYDLRVNAESNSENLHAGIIVAFFGLRYRTYCSMIARTYLVDPNKSQETNYKLLVEVHQATISACREGAAAKDVYAKAISVIKSKKPELEQYFLRNVGAGIGIEVRDSSFVLNSKNTRTLSDGMTFVVSTGFTDVENAEPQDSKSKTYSVYLSDTVRVTRDQPVVFTGNAPVDIEETSFFFKEDEPESKPKEKKKEKTRAGAAAPKNALASRLRHDRNKQADENAEAKRREHQKELQEKRLEDGLKLYAKSEGDKNGVVAKTYKRFESYKRDNQLPAKVKDLIVVVDDKNQSVVLPIMGRAVPFHINTIKNVSQNEEGSFVYLRINFLSPGQGVGRKDDQPFEEPTAQFVRSMTFRSKDKNRMDNITSRISEMKKDAVKREQEKKEMEDVVEQDKLIEIRSELCQCPTISSN